MPLINVRLIGNVLSTGQKQHIARNLTGAMVAILRVSC
jgi:phenylpyruvate tautomerase PptA (4-oxalocrotonate tautomerase family)